MYKKDKAKEGRMIGYKHTVSQILGGEIMIKYKYPNLGGWILFLCVAWIENYNKRLIIALPKRELLTHLPDGILL